MMVLPKRCEQVLAKIHKQGDLGQEAWWEVVLYFDDESGWISFHGSKTFEDGETVGYWKYCNDIDF